MKKHLQQRSSYINLVFPYLDYALNYLDENKNEIAKYESIIKLDQFVKEMECGRVIPNFLIKNELKEKFENKKISIREYFNLLNNDKSIFKIII